MDKCPPQTQLLMQKSDKTLDIEIKTDRSEYQVGDEMTIAFRTSFKGKPVPASVAVGVVDAAVYSARVDDLNAFDAFYQIHGTTDVYSVYHSDMLSIPYWGGFGNAHPISSLPMNDAWQDTLVFTQVTTDEKGEGRLQVKLPEKEGTWRITVHGVDLNFAVGTQRLSVRSKE